MNRLIYCLAVLLALGTHGVFGQKSTGAALFPDVMPDVRGVGMGNTGVASTPNAFSLYRNVAKSVFSGMRSEVGYSFTPWMRKLVSGNNLHGFAGYYNLDEKQGVVAGFRWFSQAEVDLWSDTGEAAGSFTPKNWSVDVGYARKLTDDLSVGATVRFVRSDMSGLDKDAVANAVAFDLGVYYRRATTDDRLNWAVGLQASNFGTHINYGHGKYDQQGKVSVGGMVDYVFSDKHRLEGTLDIGYRVLPETNLEGAVGVEYTALNLVSLRGGYHWGEENNRMQRYGTLGCGVNLRYVRADFAYLMPEPDSFLKNTWQVALSVDLGMIFK